ncbi:MAG TPA: hypothetical protein VF557_01630 [Jatrophihabitans sp.]|uniref:hypothetical protein n=1 Tax=Jatrophihabitans sp. TaxID=1932789 RepID=UPI002F17B240
MNTVRVLDTRTGSGLASGHVARFAVTGRGGIPAGAAAVTLNLTVLRPGSTGSIAVFPGGTAWNGAASISFVAAQTKQSMVTAKLGADGTLSVRNNIASTIQVIGDVAGYYTGGTPSTPGAFRTIGFQRAFDTRQSHALAPGSVTRMAITGRGAVPATGVAAVLANLTVITPSRAGSVSTWAGDAAWDGSASVSFAAGRTGQDVLNVALGSDGTALIRNNTGVALHVVLDLIGYYLAGTPVGYGAYQAITPTRVYDNRPGAFNEPLTPGQAVPVRPVFDQRTKISRVPEWGVPAVVVRFTVLTPAQAGSLSIFRGDRAWNGSTMISFGAGATAQQQLTTVLGLNDVFELQYNGAGSVSVVADVLGYYLGVPNPLRYTSGQEINPRHGSLMDISCPTATFCMTVQRNGFAESWHGTAWSTPVRAGRARALSSVSCTSASFCVAIGSDSSGLTVLETYDGTSWTHAINLPFNSSTTKRVSCASATFCMANSGASFATFNGSSWSTRTATGGQLSSLHSLSCPSAAFCMGTDHDGKAGTFDGASWSAPVNVTGAITPWWVSCVSASFCVAVGRAEAVTFNGAKWSAPRTIHTNHLLRVSCVSGTNCRASDSSGSVLSFDGTDWSAPMPVQANGPAVISCSSAGTCGLIEAASTKATAAMFNGASWSAPQTVDYLPGDLTGVSCTAASFCMAVETGGHALSYNGTAWTSPKQIDGGVALTGVSCTGPSFCVAVDSLGRALAFDGSGWSSAAPVYPGRLAAVSCTSSSFCVAVGADKAATFNGSSWTTPVPIVSGSSLSAVSCRSTTFCVAITKSGNATRFNGAGWSALGYTTTSGNVHTISCPTTSYCLASSFSQLSSWNGSAWSRYPYIVPAAAVYAASCPQAEFCVAAAGGGPQHGDGQASVWDGSQWSMPVTMPAGGGTSAGSAISCPSTSFCMQLDSATFAYRLDG